MAEADIIRQQIRRMRNARVEPYMVIVCGEMYNKLGKPPKLSGISVDCDCTMKRGWKVR